MNEKVEVTVGDGQTLKAKGHGDVKLSMLLEGGTKKCTLHNVLYVPDLSLNLVGVF